MLQRGNKLDMTFESFYEIYSEYKRQRVKESTFETKSHIVQTKSFPIWKTENQRDYGGRCDRLAE